MKAITQMLNNLLVDKRVFSIYLPSIIMSVYLILAVVSVQYDDVTYDEGAHLKYGIQILKGRTDRYSDEQKFRSTMPISVLNALPRAVEQLIKPGTKKNDWGKADTQNGRYITIGLTLVLFIYCYLFASSISSAKTGCIVLGFIAFDPNILAHSRLVTTDIYAATAFIATIYHLWKWLAAKDVHHFYYWCIAIAIAQCCKANSILLYPVCLVLVCIYTFNANNVFLLKRTLIRVMLFLIIQIIIINSFFLFASPWGYSLSQLNLRSVFFKSMQTSWIAKIPIPFPGAFTNAFDLIQYERETFDGTALNYLLGELRYKKGFWNYYLICYALKTPVASIFLCLSGLVYALAVKRTAKIIFLFCCWPCVFVLVFLSCSSIQNGYRYLLPVICLLIIFASFFLENIVKRISPVMILPIFVIPFFIAAVNFPNYLAFTNMFVSKKQLAYRLFADSNLNWGQRISSLKRFMDTHPDYIYEPAKPETGFIVVDINNLVGINNPDKFKWLRENYVPVATIDECYLIFSVKKQPLVQ